MVNDIYRYVSVDDVYRTAGITQEVVSRYDVERHIERAESFICRLTKNIYYHYNLEDRDIQSATDNTITIDEDDFLVNEWKGQFLHITSGTGSGQYRKIVSNDNNTIVLDRDFVTTPDATSSFSIFYIPNGFKPYVDYTADGIDGNNKNYMFLPKFPIRSLEYLKIDNTEISVNTLNIYRNEGKIVLSSDSELQTFLKTRPQLIKVKFWHGVDDLPEDVRRLVEVKSALQLLSQQMGGTFDVPSTFSLPDLNVSIGQAYVNIKGAVDVLQKEYNELVSKVRIYPVFA